MDEDDERNGDPSRRVSGWLLVTDVDGTLTGDPGALADLLDALEPTVSVVLSSSRPVDSVRGTLLGFPGSWMPDGIVGALGTEIEIGGVPDRLWNQRFTGWDRRPVDEVMARLGFPPHDDEYQTPVKASFTVPRDRRDEAFAALDAAGVEATLLVSGDSDFDVLAPGAGKGPAARHVASVLGYDEARVATAGDALIDVDMLAFGHGILVGNATEEARRAVADSAYVASAPYAAGVHEGLRVVGALGVRA